MAIPTVHIGGHIRGPGGVAPISGKVRAQLSGHASMLDGTEFVRVLGEVEVQLGAAGALSMDLEPTEAMVPSGLVWLIEMELRLRGGGYWRRSEIWQVASAPSTLDVGSVTRLDAVDGVAVMTSAAVSEAVVAQAEAAAQVQVDAATALAAAASGSASSATASALAAAGSETAAGSSAAAAAASESAAAAAESAAEGARDSAISARDLAAAAAVIKGSTAEGIAAVADGAFFAVPAAAPYDDWLILYQRSGAAAVEKSRSIGAGSVYLGAMLEYAWAVQDQAQGVAIGVTPDGTVRVHTLEARSLVPDAVTLAGYVQTERAEALGFVWAIVDASDRVALGVRPDGTVEVSSLLAGAINAARNNPAQPDRNWGAEINHVLGYGQSLALGNNATPVLTTAQRHDSLRFVGGVRPVDGGSYASLVTLVETAATAYGETPIAGACEGIHDTVLAEDGLAYGDHSFTLLGSTGGQSGQSLLGLSSGSANYTTLMDHVTNGLARAVALGKSYKVLGVLWSQGETDADLGTTAATYRSQLQTLITDLNTDIKSITGQTDDVHVIGYQFSSWKVYAGATWEIPLALLAEANANALFHVVGPNYHLTHNADNVHLTNESSKRLGAYYGRMLKRIAVNGEAPTILQPVASHVSGAVAVLKFSVPEGPLVIDTTKVAAATNYGFELVDAGGGALTVSSVALLGDNRVKITAASSIPAGARVLYAASGAGTTGPLTGPRGNLRDSAGVRSLLDPAGLNWPLHNWCVHFDWAL